MTVGGGHVGFGAALACATAGREVLLIEPSGQLLWEATRGLDNRVTGVAGDAEKGWARWIAGLRAKGAANDEFFDPAFAEMAAARVCADPDSGVAALFYAMPLAATRDGGGGIAALRLATKSGPRVLRARRWIDASETGMLAMLAEPGGAARMSRRVPVERRLAMVLQAPTWDDGEATLAAFCEAHGARLLGSLRSTERRIMWPAEGARSWAEEMRGWTSRLRTAFPLPSPVIVSQCATEAVPVYAACDGSRGAEAGGGIPNLLVLSPAHRDETITSPAERFSLGARAGLEPTEREKPRAVGGAVATCSRSERSIEVDVLVAGAGTAGALAAIAAGREGARVCALEFTSFPGGVGTGAGITCYFHGLKGGLQTEIDRRTLELNRMLEGRELAERRWHHDGKKIALLDCFAAAGVRFVGGALLAEVCRDERGRVASVLAATDEGPLRIVARAFVDCTGDGDLCALAGVAFESGRAGDGRTLAYSQSVFALRGEEEGLAVVARNFDAGWTDPTDAEELTRARLEGVAQHARPRWEEGSCPLGVAPLPGIRQSRQIATDYALRFRDLAGHARFADAVGEAESIADTHSVDFEFEDDEAVFFFCVCRLFRHSLRAQLPYRMMLPRGLENVWIACRAAGLETSASYAVRMQRDMQRLGEVAGRAAALAARGDGKARPAPAGLLLTCAGDSVGDGPADWLAELAKGRPGLHLWRLFAHAETGRDEVRVIARGEGTREASFFAAAVLAMRGDDAGEARLLAAIEAREEGPPPSENNTGAHGQEIDLPFWLLAVILLRRGGSEACLPALRGVAEDREAPLNVRTAVALTLERLAADGRIAAEDAAETAERLVRPPLPDTMLAPTRSIWRALRGAPQLRLRNDAGADTRQDHAWQLHLVVARIRAAAGLPELPAATAYRQDARPWIRREFARLRESPRPQAVPA